MSKLPLTASTAPTTPGVDEHIAQLYHALNELLPGYVVRPGSDEFEPIVPHPECAAHSGLENARRIFEAHARCCGDQYDEWLMDGALTRRRA